MSLTIYRTTGTRGRITLPFSFRELLRRISNNTYIKIVFDGVRLIITPMVDKGKYLQEFDVGVNLTENEADELLIGYSKESLINMQAAVQKRLQMCTDSESASNNGGK